MTSHPSRQPRRYLFLLCSALSIPHFSLSFSLPSLQKTYSFIDTTNHPFRLSSIIGAKRQFAVEEEEEGESHLTKDVDPSRRMVMMMTSAATLLFGSLPVVGEDVVAEVEVLPRDEVKRLFSEAQVLESQGNLASANRIFAKVTKLAPNFIYGWSGLGNTQVAFGALQLADESYTKAINLCNINLKTEEKFGVPRCKDLYLLLLNRGSVRLNNNMPKEALLDLEQAANLRNQPDALILQNRARAREYNQLYGPSDSDYTVAISMTSNEVNPFWLRSAMVKFQLGDEMGAFDLLRRVEVRFPDAPEVKAAKAAMLWSRGDEVGAKKKFGELPEKQMVKFGDGEYLRKVVVWPGRMIESLGCVTSAIVGVQEKEEVVVGDGQIDL